MVDVLCIGELLWDCYPDQRHLGGAPFNVCCHVRQFGIDALMISAVGDDEPGRAIIDGMETTGMALEGLAVHRHHVTGRVDITLDAAGKPGYEIVDDVAWDHIPVGGDLLAMAARCRAICFGSLAQRSAESRRSIRELLETADDDCLRVFDVNLRLAYHDADLIRGGLERCEVLKLNDEELPVIAGYAGIGGDDRMTLLRQLVERYDLEVVALTCGSEGSLLMNADGVIDEQPAAPCKAVDTVGAGDSFCACLIDGLLREEALETINRRANRVAAHVCSQRGATPTLPDGLL